VKQSVIFVHFHLSVLGLSLQIFYCTVKLFNCSSF